MKKKSLAILQPARLDAAKFRQLYAGLLRSRLVVEKLKALEEQGGLVQAALPQAGHEAIEAGLLIDLLPDDRVAPGSHSITARLLRGETVKSIIGEMLGAKKAVSRSKGNQASRNTIPSSLTLAGQINLALGAAWAFKTGGTTQVAVSLSEDGAIAPELWNEAVQFSVLNKLPMVHVAHVVGEGPGPVGSLSNLCANLSRSLPVLIVDGDDAVAVYRVGQEAVRRARQGHGPSLIRCQTSGPAESPPLSDSPQDSQLSTEPIRRLETYLRQKSYWSERWKRGLVSSFSRELECALERAGKNRLKVLRPDRSAESVLASAV